jgi:hypothetical protein
MTLNAWRDKYPSFWTRSRGVLAIIVENANALNGVTDYEAISMEPTKVTLIPKPPAWTLFDGVLWQFFADKSGADAAYTAHRTLGNAPTLRPYHEDDAVHYNPDPRR